ncbi:MAG: HPr family phosphocarrier protein [Actinobacteria bacterium]|nr:HPr family phosphocarrier protein [Actinomycetota bacterium]
MAVERTIVVRTPEGLHARPAALFVQTAGRFSGDIELEARGQKANGKSILSVLKLGVHYGEALTIRTRGGEERDEQAVLNRLVAILSGLNDGGPVQD